jgi:hypothetical protein
MLGQITNRLYRKATKIPISSVQNSTASTVPAAAERIILLCLLLLAVWLFWRIPLTVPPGLEMDELIEAQIAQKILAGNWQPFYESGQGREGLYHYWLAGWLWLVGESVLSLRLASSTLVVLALAIGYVWWRNLFGRPVALLALALAITSFWLLFAARSGLRSTSLLPLSLLAAYTYWRALSAEDRQLWFWSGCAGITLGLSLYTYTAARVLPGVFVLFTLYLALFHHLLLVGKWRAMLFGAVTAVLVTLPLFAFLLANPAVDQFDFEDFDRPWVALQEGDPRPAMKTSLATFGQFAHAGDPLIFDNVPGRPIFPFPLGWLFWLGVGLSLLRWRQPAYMFCVLWLFIGLIPGMLSQPAPNFYRTSLTQATAFLFPAITVVTLLEWSQGVHFRQNITALTGAVLALLLIGIQLPSTWHAYYQEWPTVEGVTFFWQRGLQEAAHYLDNQPVDDTVAICTVLTYEHDPWWRPAWQSMPYLLRQVDRPIRYFDCRTTMILPAGDSILYLFPDHTQPAELLPADLAASWLTAAPHLPGVFSPDQGTAIRLAERPVDPWLPAQEIAYWSPEADNEQTHLPALWDNSLLLRGYQPSATSLAPGETLRLATVWEVVARPPARLSLFAHLLADPATVVSQQDGLPLTSHLLEPGDLVWVLYDAIPIPPDLTEGSYYLALGLYDSGTLQRLSLHENGTVRGDRLFLEPIIVQKP